MIAVPVVPITNRHLGEATIHMLSIGRSLRHASLPLDAMNQLIGLLLGKNTLVAR